MSSVLERQAIQRRTARIIRSAGGGLMYRCSRPEWISTLLGRCGIIPITDVFLSYLDNLDEDVWRCIANIHSVRVLAARASSIRDVDLSHVSHNRRMVFLDIGITAISDEGVNWLGACSHLETLFLDDTRITNQCLAVLSQLPELASLYLDNTSVDGNGLEELAGLTQLRSLSLHGTGMIAHDVNSLRTQLPACKVHWRAERTGTDQKSA